MRYSKQREVVFEVVSKSDDHPEVKKIYERVKEKIPNISLGTVYRNLNTLSADNQIKKIISFDGEHFDKTTYEHYHAYCDICKNVFDVNLKFLSDTSEKIEKNTGIKVISCNFIIKGICHNCQKNKKERED
ncbi:MAG: transcriptional repressor [Bacilli bacterium]